MNKGKIITGGTTLTAKQTSKEVPLPLIPFISVGEGYLRIDARAYNQLLIGTDKPKTVDDYKEAGYVIDSDTFDMLWKL